MDYLDFRRRIIDKLGIKEDHIFKIANIDDLNYLISSKYPDCIIKFYSLNELKESIDYNGASLLPIIKLKEENENYTPGYIIFELDYRIIGSTIYGDVYCININQINEDGQPNVFIASHDEIYEDLSEDEIESGIIKIADSFNEFLEKFINKELPTSYHDVE